MWVITAIIVLVLYFIDLLLLPEGRISPLIYNCSYRTDLVVIEDPSKARGPELISDVEFLLWHNVREPIELILILLFLNLGER